MENKKKHIIFIANPISGTRGKEIIINNIHKLIDKNLFSYEIALTQYAGHAAIIAQNAAEKGIDIVVAVGGDGTINEVARSLVHTDTTLGIIPCGSGNGLARHLQIPINSKKAIEIINKCHIKSLDYGKVNEMPFFCTCGIGFDAFVSLKFAETGKRGLLTYIDSTLKEWLQYKPETYTIENETGSIQYKAVLIACANASQYGNNAYICPDASMSDGLMDVTIMEPFNYLQAPQIAFQLFNKTLNSNSHIKTFKSKKIRITREKEGAIHCDGDPLNVGTTIDVEVIEKGLNVITCATAKKKPENFVQVFGTYLNNAYKLSEESFQTNSKRFIEMNRTFIDKIKNK
ncbi:MAG: diacylglycerol kinase family lipid kinase [Bacteroidaceae bacterium]